MILTAQERTRATHAIYLVVGHRVSTLPRD